MNGRVYKVSYDSLWEMTSTVGAQTNKWIEELKLAEEKAKVIVETSNMAGVASDNIKEYFKFVHLTVIGLLSQLLYVHNGNCQSYMDDYRSNIDNGLHTIINFSELCDYNSEIEQTNAKAINIDESISYVMGGIKDIFRVSYNDVSDVCAEHILVSNYILDLNDKINALEQNHYDNDFMNSEQLISSLKSFITEQLSCERGYQTSFTLDSLSSSEAFGNLYLAFEAINQEIEDKEKLIETSISNNNQYASALQQEAEDSRSWCKWVAVGIGIVGSVVLIVVTAGAASPLVCAGVGAAVGVTTAAANEFADNYVSNGSFTDGMDWSQFGKNLVIGSVTGAISGALAATSSIGSAIKQPIDAAMASATKSIATSGAEGIIGTIWDVGEAVITGKPVDECVDIFERNASNMLKDVVVDGLTNFAGGYIGGTFGVNAGKKGFWTKIGEKTLENTTEAFVENFAEGFIDVGSAIVDPNSSKNVTTVIREELNEFLEETSNDVVKGGVDSLVSGIFDGVGSKSKNETFKTIKNILSDTVSDTVGTVAGSVAEQGVEIRLGDRRDLDLNEIWEEDLQNGRNILVSAGKSAGENITEQLNDDSLTDKMRIKDYDKDGKIDIVEFEKYSVTKEDYDAAREVAGKGAYADQSVQDILGLPKNTAVSTRKITIKSVMVEDIEESDYKGRKDTNATKLNTKK